MISAPRLEAGLAAQRVELGGALRVDPVPSRYSTSYALHDLTVLRADGPPLALVVKDLEWASMLPEARTAGLEVDELPPLPEFAGEQRADPS